MMRLRDNDEVQVRITVEEVENQPESCESSVFVAGWNERQSLRQ